MCKAVIRYNVSTHSRLKAAGHSVLVHQIQFDSFNTQPPKGGWVSTTLQCLIGWVSTHSRLKAAGGQGRRTYHRKSVSTHSRLKAAGRRVPRRSVCTLRFNTQPPKGGWVVELPQDATYTVVSTHSRLKAAGTMCGLVFIRSIGFNTQPPKGGWLAEL